MDNPYLRLTGELNQGRLRAVLSSGQAVVIHRLAVMSKDGDWILRQDDEALGHTLGVLARHGARYRFGAPLDRRWLAHGWSSHFEMRQGALRLRADFVTRPPRLDEAATEQLFRAAEGTEVPVVGLEPLAELKKTNREKDYPVIGELARRMTSPRARLLYSRSSRDLEELAAAHPALLAGLVGQRPVLARIGDGREALETALDAERRVLMRANEDRLARYQRAASLWRDAWRQIDAAIAELPLEVAHRTICERAATLLPYDPDEAPTP